MPSSESTYAGDWLQIARKDHRRCVNMLDDSDPEAAGFFLQQALEKYLKAFLLFHGWPLKRIHDLEVLLNDALAYDSSLEEFRPLCQRVSGYYMLERYPLTMQAGIEEADVQQSLREAERLIAKLEMQFS